MISVLPTLLLGYCSTVQYSTVDRACFVDWLGDQKPAMTSMHDDNIDTTLRVRAVLHSGYATPCSRSFHTLSSLSVVILLP
eukprot:COSAG06_NODE_2761_length_6333_cov_5.558196_3_plen_81_part_00